MNNSTETKKNVIIIGYGGQGGWHADQILKNNVVGLRGIYDIDPKKAEKARAKGIHAFSSLDEALSDKDADIVVVATPNDVHRDIVIDALKSGHSVVCEKPCVIDLHDFDMMVEASERCGKLFTVHQNRRWDVDYLAMKAIIASGELGTPIRIESRIHGSRGIPSDWRCQKEFGGGMMYDWGVHLIDQMLLLIPERITGLWCSATHITTQEVDDGFFLELKFASGKTAHIEVGTYNFIAMPRFYMQCSSGSAIIEDWRKNAHAVKCKAWNEADVLPVQTAAGITKTMAPRDSITVDEYDCPRPVSDVHDFYRNLVRAIDGEEAPAVSLRQVRRVIRVMEDALRSAETGRALEIDY